MTDPRPLFIGVGGGSGSGKTTIAERVAAALPAGSVRLISHDAYYRDHPQLDDEARAQLNFDHPEALETELLVEHLARLRAGNAVEVPSYDFEIHRRSSKTTYVEPSPVVIVEGILVLVDAGLRDQFDIKIYVDTDPDIRVLRRVRRDMQVRGRSFESVREQYYATVRPMHLQYVEPTRRMADLIIPEGGENAVALEVILARLRAAL
jgi:uridine kinase